jgi:uncharacterized membrane protein YozB (DUF420 family)
MMVDFLAGSGFLGTQAPYHSDLALVFILTSALMFTLGVLLAIRRQFEIHRWVQTTAAILNTVAVLTVMIGSFITYILPGIPAKLQEGSYGVTTVHALVGTVGMLFGIFVVLRANGLMPKKLRFKNYKLFMRIAYALYMLATVLGVVVYVAVYVYGI